MRRSLACAVALLVLALAAAPAGAHVTVTRAGAQTLAFDVPNERESSTTVRVDVIFPPELRDGGVHVAPVSGWAATVKHRGAAVSEIDWTVTSRHSAIGGTEARTFTVTVGPLPKVRQLVFKALQHYADGTIVRWIQAPDPAAERPAAVLTLSGGSAQTGDAGGGASSLPWLALAAVLVVAMAAAALVARRRRST